MDHVAATINFHNPENLRAAAHSRGDVVWVSISSLSGSSGVAMFFKGADAWDRANVVAKSFNEGMTAPIATRQLQAAE